MKEYIKRLQNIADDLAQLGQDLSGDVHGSRAELRLLLPLAAALKSIRAALARLPLLESDGHIRKDTVIPLMGWKGPQKCKHNQKPKS